MADLHAVRRRRVAPERFDYRRGLEQIANFVDNELGNGRVPQPRPDDREWRIQRAKTIRILQELMKKLDNISVGANYGKVAGNGTEILGTAGTIIGAIMCLRGIPAGLTLKNVGDLVQNAGAFIDGVSSVIELAVSANYLGEIEKVLKEDQELSRPLMQWLNFSNELDTNVQAIFGVSLASERFSIVMKALYEFSKSFGQVTDFEAAMRLMRQGRYSVLIGTDVEVGILRKLFEECSSSPLFRDRIRVVLSVLSVSTLGIQGFIKGVQVAQYFSGTSSITPSLQSGLNPGIPTTREVSEFCFFQAINMARSIVSLINAANIIKNGKSKYSDAIKQIIRCLTAELRQMEEL